MTTAGVRMRAGCSSSGFNWYRSATRGSISIRRRRSTGPWRGWSASRIPVPDAADSNGGLEVALLHLVIGIARAGADRAADGGAAPGATGDRADDRTTRRADRAAAEGALLGIAHVGAAGGAEQS